MRLISLNTGLPTEVEYNNKTVRTGIFKYPNQNKLKVSFLGIETDGQADLKNHGGEYKAVYSYPYQHYQYWQNKLPDIEITYGIFGENLTIDGDFDENKVNIGDCFQIGTCQIIAVQPRIPCFKLAIRFNNQYLPKLFLESMKPGVYFQVLQEGEIELHQEVKLIKKSESNMSINDILKLMMFDTENYSMMEKAVNIPELAPNIKGYFSERLNSLS